MRLVFRWNDVCGVCVIRMLLLRGRLCAHHRSSRRPRVRSPREPTGVGVVLLPNHMPTPQVVTTGRTSSKQLARIALRSASLPRVQAIARSPPIRHDKSLRPKGTGHSAVHSADIGSPLSILILAGRQCLPRLAYNGLSHFEIPVAQPGGEYLKTMPLAL